MAAHRARIVIARLRRWNAKVFGWRDTHPWWYAAFVAGSIALIGGVLFTPLRLAPLGYTLQSAAIAFLVWGVLGSLRVWWLRRASAGGSLPRPPQ
ncbi:MAG TPA: hypothetical protein VFL91_32650 [Thermomicrobiales bacterium]|nr:hypothetical protein [Thermomicrobiales bacterium]